MFADALKSFVVLTGLLMFGAPAHAAENDYLIQLNHQGRLAMDRGDNKLALSYFKKACDGGLKLACRNIGTVHYNTGIPLFQAKKYAEAQKLFTTACDLGEGDGCYNLGVQYEQGLGVTKDPQRARGFYDKGCKTGSALACGAPAKMVFAANAALCQNGKFDQNVKGCTALINSGLLKGADLAPVHIMRAGAHFLAGKYAQALPDAEKAISLAPREPQLLEARAEIYEKLGQKDKAIAGYRAVLQVDPNMKAAKEGLKRLTGGSMAGGSSAGASPAGGANNPPGKPSKVTDIQPVNNCVRPVAAGQPGAGNFGMLENTCSFAIDVRYCNDKVKKDSWADSMSCMGGGKNWGGSGSIQAHQKSAAHIGGRTYWFACKQPAGVVEATFVKDQGIRAKCR